MFEDSELNRCGEMKAGLPPPSTSLSSFVFPIITAILVIVWV